MFSPATKKHNFSSQKDRHLGHEVPGSPGTPLPDNQRSSSYGTSIPNWPNTGTPAPWASRLSVLARIPLVKENEKGTDADPIQPVYVGEFPEEVRDAQSSLLQKSIPGDARISGGMDKGTALSWIVCGKWLFVWSYLSPAASKECIILDFPSSVSERGDISSMSNHGSMWMVSVVNWDNKCGNTDKVVQQCNSAGIVMLNQKTGTVIYWPDIYSKGGASPVCSLASFDESEANFSPGDGKASPNRHRQSNKLESAYLAAPVSFNSLIASAIPGTWCVCFALACTSNGELWQFQCSPSGICPKKIPLNLNISSSQSIDNAQPLVGKGYPRSLIWRFRLMNSVESLPAVLSVDRS